MTSGQIAALMQQQSQMFMGAAAYGAQVSATMPSPYMGAGNIGSYGMSSPAVQFPSMPYAPASKPGFSYGGNNAGGYGLGNQMAGMGVSALGGAAIAGLGIGGMFTNFLDPIGGGLAGGYRAFSAGRGVGGILGGAAMGALPGLAATYAVSHVAGQMVHGAQEQAAIQNSLGQFNFINSGSRTGRGFSRTDAASVGNMVRELQAIPEMMTSMSELTRIMDRVGQMGLMQGVRDAHEFNKKFKETVGTLKDLSKILGSTMEEALPVLQQSRLAGIYNPHAIKQNVLQRQVVGGVTGMSADQVTSLMMQGSQMSFAYGGSRGGGARSALRVAGELGMANQMGILSNDKIVEMTGLEGAAGLQALSGAVNEAGYRMSQSSLGTAMTLALGETKNGRFTGGMDEELVRRVREGSISKSELLQLAKQKTRGRGAKLSYKAHEHALRSEMVNRVGVQGMAMEMEGILGERGWHNEDALNLVMQRYHIDERMAETVVEVGKNMPGIESKLNTAARTEARSKARQSFLRENASWEGIKKKIGKRWENAVEEPLRKVGAEMHTSIGEYVDNYVDEMLGNYKKDITEGMDELLQSANRGSPKAKARLEQIKKNTGFGTYQGADYSVGASAQILSAFTGDKVAGEERLRRIRALTGDEFITTLSDHGKIDVPKGFTTLSNRTSGWGYVEAGVVGGAGMLASGGTLGGAAFSAAAMSDLVHHDVVGVTEDNMKKLKARLSGGLINPQLEEELRKNPQMAARLSANLEDVLDQQHSRLMEAGGEHDRLDILAEGMSEAGVKRRFREKRQGKAMKDLTEGLDWTRLSRKYSSGTILATLARTNPELAKDAGMIDPMKLALSFDDQSAAAGKGLAEARSAIAGEFGDSQAFAERIVRDESGLGSLLDKVYGEKTVSGYSAGADAATLSDIRKGLRTGKDSAARLEFKKKYGLEGVKDDDLEQAQKLFSSMDPTDPKNKDKIQKLLNYRGASRLSSLFTSAEEGKKYGVELEASHKKYSQSLDSLGSSGSDAARSAIAKMKGLETSLKETGEGGAETNAEIAQLIASASPKERKILEQAYGELGGSVSAVDRFRKKRKRGATTLGGLLDKSLFGDSDEAHKNLREAEEYLGISGGPVGADAKKLKLTKDQMDKAEKWAAQHPAAAKMNAGSEMFQKFGTATSLLAENVGKLAAAMEKKGTTP